MESLSETTKLDGLAVSDLLRSAGSKSADWTLLQLAGDVSTRAYFRLESRSDASLLAREILQAAFLFAILPKKNRPPYDPPVDHNQNTGKRFLLFLGGEPSGSPTELTFVTYSGRPAPKFLHQTPIDEAFRRPAIHRKETLLASGPQDKCRFYLSRDAGERDGSKIPVTLSPEMQSLLKSAEDAGIELAKLSLATA